MSSLSIAVHLDFEELQVTTLMYIDAIQQTSYCTIYCAGYDFDGLSPEAPTPTLRTLHNKTRAQDIRMHK
jgi:hypothetical protein